MTLLLFQRLSAGKILLSCLLINSICQSIVCQKNITVLGTGYVGLVLGACLAKFGNHVICADIDIEKIAMLQQGKIPIFEPGLTELTLQQIKERRLTFSSNINKSIQESDVIFIAVGTPMDDTGRANLNALETVAKNIGQNLNGYKVICTKSTVPIGTGTLIRDIIFQQTGNINFDIVSNPEFLREGSAVKDFLEPDRVIIGLQSSDARRIMDEIYMPLHQQNIPFLYTDIITAETIKYAANSFLATKISYINEIANLCDKTGANIALVSEGMGLDKRIGKQFLNPGPGFGGSCFPKDAQALLHKASEVKVNLNVLKAALEANVYQRTVIINKVSQLLNHEFKNKTIAILGLAFKANTDDIRYSPALDIIQALVKQGALIKAYDPIAAENTKRILPTISYATSAEDASIGADCIIILTEWAEFKNIDFAKIIFLVNSPNIVDARNIINSDNLRKLGFNITNIGNYH